ncbi:MAG: bacteriophage abortive infection AbiH family protein [Paludibacteraceae bacterium]|nr:bacteriophage abortive infection AbiH family protein [Paludibacteraceae bacterium]
MEYTIEKYNSTSKTLYIIGNGFDLAHRIKSSYADFKGWCIKNSVGLQLDFLLNPNANWSDIEESLGKDKNENHIYENIDPYDGDYRNLNPFEVSNVIEDSVEFLFEETMKFLKPAFRDWVNSIDINKFKKSIYDLEPDSFYLTFNYTETLEEFYNIPSEQICHIHGSRLEKKDKYVFGHNSNRDVVVRNEGNMMDWEIKSKKEIIKFMNNFEKPYNKCKIKLENFIKNKNIEKIIVYGHSLGEVDWPYFEKIVELLGCKIPWEVDCFDDADVERMHKLENHLGLLNIKKEEYDD